MSDDEEGIPGVPGTPGETGATGTPGATGASGATGAAGAAGRQGRSGTPGARGIAGPPGPEGGSTPALSATLRELAEAIDAQALVLHKDRRDRMWMAGIAAMVLLLGLFVIGDARRQAKTNGQIGSVILAVTGCTVKDTPEQCSERVKAGARAEGARRIAEVDCADRRREAGLPAPIPPDSCQSQTPPEVYPGKARPGS